ncbi:DUF6879 family protein [Streptomyces sp. SID8352]|uniref:DUF6879 family protein n=1 Tax=Streptomyces sp. SID8352 TaxID=2690338 RepID=UPI0013691643|nr:DUF6879 family protein [Streptomyces sp. SID8352]MYU25507.1 hypothetical protein [Streptomyces sp. SID8352]
MGRRLRFTGTESKNGGCPALHEDTRSGEIIVQGPPLTDLEDLARLKHFGPGDRAVVVPRELLVNHGPKELDRVPDIIDLDEFGKLFHHFEHSAWHLETRRGYASDREDEGYATFLATGEAPMDLDSDWCQNISAQTAAGKYIGRVRVVDDPPTDGQRFLLSYARCNAATGEDARNLWREDAEAALLPDEDFWLFDSRIVAILRFDDEDVFHDVEVITDPAEVLRYCQVRDAAVHASIPYDAFAARLTD